MVTRKPTLEENGVFPVAGYGLTGEFTLSASGRSTDGVSRGRHYLHFFDNVRWLVSILAVGIATTMASLAA
jgi:hypothetical protein